MLTNIDRGEANVFLATSQALLQRDAAVHFATFDGFQDAVARVSRAAAPRAAAPIAFHAIRGLTMEGGVRQCVARAGVAVAHGYLPASFVSPLRFAVTAAAIRDSCLIMAPYDGPQLVEIVASVVAIIDRVAPDLVVVDSLMTAGLTACAHAGARFICLSPNSIKTFARPAPWRYPL